MGVARSYNSTSALRPDLAFIRASRFGTWGDAASGWATDQEGSLLFEVKVQGSAWGQDDLEEAGNPMYRRQDGKPTETQASAKQRQTL